MSETYHIARADQIGDYPQSRTLADALREAYDVVNADGVPVAILLAAGPLSEGARVEWTPLCVISPPKEAAA